MSCRDLRSSALGLLAASLVLAASGCAAGAAAEPSAGSSARAADDLTRRIAEVESARQCVVSSLTFPDEAGITADLDARLAAAGLTHAQWKDWHDALAGSPDLVAQLSEVSAPGCAGA